MKARSQLQGALLHRCHRSPLQTQPSAEPVKLGDGSMLILVPAVSLKDQSLGVGQDQKTDAISH